MVVKNAVANKEAVRIAVNAGELRGKSFGATVRARRQERVVSVCGDSGAFPKISELEAWDTGSARSRDSGSRSVAIPISSQVDSGISAQTDVALPGEMIDFRRPHFREDAAR
jgi:hypothetical protein